MKLRSSLLAGVIVALALSRGAGSPALAAQNHDHDQPAEAQAPTAPDGAMTMHAQMMAAMKAHDARLESLVKTMDGATGTAKIDTMATIIRELVQSEKAMHAGMVEMHQHMMPAPAPK